MKACSRSKPETSPKNNSFKSKSSSSMEQKLSDSMSSSIVKGAGSQRKMMQGSRNLNYKPSSILHRSECNSYRMD